jgi:hypothetical protein
MLAFFLSDERGRDLARSFRQVIMVIIMLMSAMGVLRFIVCASFHRVHRVRINS